MPGPTRRFAGGVEFTAGEGADDRHLEPALLGILFKLTIAHRFKILSLVTYLTMGWLSLIVVYQLAVKLAVGGVTLLAVGGVVYSLGSSSTSANVFLITTLSGTASCSAAACVTSAIYLYIGQS
nr:hemolysin [Klebsiella pneumoniae]